MKNKIYFLSLGLIFIFLTSVIKTHPGSPNDLSRLAGIVSIARFNQLNIDNTTQVTTIDKAKVGDKFYSSKPPVLNWVLGYIIKWGFTTVKPALIQNDVAIYKTATFFATTLPLLLTLSLFLLAISTTFKSTLKPLLASIPLLLSTLFLGYAQYLNNHIPVALFTFVGFAAVFILKLKPHITDALLGISLSAILALDPPFALITTLTIIPFLIFKYKAEILKRSLRILLFALPLSLLHFYLNLKIFSIWTIPQFYQERFFAYEGSHWINKSLDDINVYNPGFLTIVFNYLFLSHGFFLYTPIFMLFFFYKDKKESGWLFSLLLLLLSSVAYSLFSTNYGGWSYGARRLIPLIPLIYLYTIKTSIQFSNKILYFVVIPLFIISIFSAYLGYENTWNNKRLYINRKVAYFPLLYNLNRKYLHFYDFDP